METGKELTGFIKKKKIIAIIRGFSFDEIMELTEALYRGGIRLAEVTFNQKSPDCIKDTVEAIKAISQKYTDMYVGAGTVITEEQLNAAYHAGAKYIITPNTDVKIIKQAVSLGMLAIPGAYSPTEIVKAYQAGAAFVKLFPADSLDVSYIKAVRGPLSHIPMLAVGGVDLNNMADFYKAGVCGFGIGGNIVDAKLVHKGDFEGLTELAESYVRKAENL